MEDLQEISFVTGTETTSPQRQAAVATSALHLTLRHGVPAEVELPVEAAPRHIGPCDVLEGFVTYDVNDWTYHGRPGKEEGDRSAMDPTVLSMAQTKSLPEQWGTLTPI